MRPLTLFAVLLLAAAAAAVPTAVLPTPPYASAQQTVTFTVTLDKPTPCYGIENPTLFSAANLIMIAYDLRDPGTAGCIQIVTPDAFDIEGGPFLPGVYLVHVAEHAYYGETPIGLTTVQGALEVYFPSANEPRTWSAVKALYR